MDVHRIPTEAGDPAAVLEILLGLGSRSLALPEDADLTPLLPSTGGVRAVWVSADGPGTLDAGVVLYVHGGGFESRMPELMNLFAHRVSRATARPVLVVHYGLAPAARFPVPLDDVLAVYRSLLDQGVPAERIVLLGESSGAALVLSALHALKTSGTALPAGVITHSAVTDLSLASPSIDGNTGGDLGVDRALLTRLIGQYLGDAPPDEAPQSPIHGPLDGLPPLLLAVGSAEALLDDTMRYGRAAAEAGTAVEVDVYDRLPHTFPLLVLEGANATGRRLLDRIGAWVAARSCRDGAEVG